MQKGRHEPKNTVELQTTTVLRGRKYTTMLPKLRSSFVFVFIDHSILITILLLYFPPSTQNQQKIKFTRCHITTTQT